jgi:hypothetical protein
LGEYAPYACVTVRLKGLGMHLLYAEERVPAFVLGRYCVLLLTSPLLFELFFFPLKLLLESYSSAKKFVYVEYYPDGLNCQI